MKINYLLIAVIIMLFIPIGINFCNKPKVQTNTVYKKTTDTLVVYKTDTLVVKKPKLVQTITHDTITAYLPSLDSLKLVYADKVYSDSSYKAYVSGYNANLDSIEVYQKTKYETINNVIRETIYKEKWSWYLDLGVNVINGGYYPNIGTTLSAPNGFKLSGELGIFDKKAYYGFKVGYRIK